MGKREYYAKHRPLRRLMAIGDWAIFAEGHFKEAQLANGII